MKMVEKKNTMVHECGLHSFDDTLHPGTWHCQPPATSFSAAQTENWEIDSCHLNQLRPPPGLDKRDELIEQRLMASMEDLQLLNCVGVPGTASKFSRSGS